MLTAEQVTQTLAPRPVRFFATLESTNDAALAWLHEGAASGSVVIADEQTRGRGRLGRVWQTPAGAALAASVVLRPPPHLLHQITMVGALAVVDLLDGLGLSDVGVKWPNDVQVRGRKVSGVLSEAAWRGQNLDGVVLGIGVNVRVDFAGTGLADRATSIEMELGRPVDRLALLASLLDAVDRWYDRLESGLTFDCWKRRLTTLGQTVTLQGGALVGQAEAVDEQGGLLVRGLDGRLRRVLAGDIAPADRS